MKNVTFFIISLFYSLSLFSQELPYYTSYSWDEKPKYTVDPSTSDELLELKTKIVTEFYFDEESSLVEYFLEHLI